MSITCVPDQTNHCTCGALREAHGNQDLLCRNCRDMAGISEESTRALIEFGTSFPLRRPTTAGGNGQTHYKTVADFEDNSSSDENDDDSYSKVAVASTNSSLIPTTNDSSIISAELFADQPMGLQFDAAGATKDNEMEDEDEDETEEAFSSSSEDENYSDIFTKYKDEIAEYENAQQSRAIEQEKAEGASLTDGNISTNTTAAAPEEERISTEQGTGVKDATWEKVPKGTAPTLKASSKPAGSNIRNFRPGRWFCDLCDKTFANKSNLARHRQGKHPDAPYARDIDDYYILNDGSVRTRPSPTKMAAKTTSETVASEMGTLVGEEITDDFLMGMFESFGGDSMNNGVPDIEISRLGDSGMGEDFASDTRSPSFSANNNELGTNNLQKPAGPAARTIPQKSASSKSNNQFLNVLASSAKFTAFDPLRTYYNREEYAQGEKELLAKFPTDGTKMIVARFHQLRENIKGDLCKLWHMHAGLIMQTKGFPEMRMGVAPSAATQNPTVGSSTEVPAALPANGADGVAVGKTPHKGERKRTAAAPDQKENAETTDKPDEPEAATKTTKKKKSRAKKGGDWTEWKMKAANESLRSALGGKPLLPKSMMDLEQTEENDDVIFGAIDNAPPPPKKRRVTGSKQPVDGGTAENS